MIPIIEIIRLQEDTETGTLGIMKINKETFCFTLEPPDRVNAPFVSNIPEQQYKCIKYDSTKFGETFKILKVPGRTDVVFHTGNKQNDTAGCILIGDWRYSTKNKLINSQVTFRAFMMMLTGFDEFHLTISKCY